MTMTKRPQTEHLILVAFVVVAVIYSVATPIFEASDEWHHFPFVKHIADGRGLPVQSPGVKTAWEQEGSQPPLYYALVSPIARWIDTSDMADRLRYNPHAQPGDPSVWANKNLIVHSVAEAFPWRGTTLAVHLIRLISVAMGALTVALTGLLVRTIAPARLDLARGAMAIVAFNPMFLFVSATVNNDNLVNLLSTLALVLIVQCMNEPDRARRWWVRRVVLAVTIALAALTKVSGLMLLAPAALGLSVADLGRPLGPVSDRRSLGPVSHRRSLGPVSDRARKRWAGSGLILVATIVVLAGWWYLRNYQLYGEWFGVETMAKVAGVRDAIPTLLELAGEFEGFKIAYWALFGAVNILTFPLAYVFFDVFSIGAVLGLIAYTVRAWRSGSRPELWPWLAMLGFAFTLFVGVVRWTSMTPASQGRLLFPAIGAIGALMWLGWDTLWSRRVTGRLNALKWSAPLAMLVIAAQAPFADILPTYASPRFVERSAVPPGAQIVNATFDDRLRLIGVAASREPIPPDRHVSFTAYWECLAAMDVNYSVFVSLKGRGLVEVGKLDAYPQRGLLATSDCPPGAIFADDYRLRVASDATQPTILRAQIGLMDWTARREALLEDGSGQAIPSLLFEVGALPAGVSLPAPPVGLALQFDDVIRLDGYRLAQNGAAIDLDLHWSALARPTEDYTVFVHLLDSRDVIVAQWDSQPLTGDYPTSWWRPGERILDARRLPLPDGLSAGAYRLEVGLYRASDGSRLPVRDEDGAPVPDSRVIWDVEVLP
ncbi:MAG TPA: phospholipid carrier-dependent glycosyltransferase [Anaerolineae bacterium]|nr:phospholipid carrier-dependent glycosyltransferase [Anaerolineae bacterium]